MKRKWMILIFVLLAAILVAVAVQVRGTEDSTETLDPSKEIYTSVGRCLIADNGAYVLIKGNSPTVLYNASGDESIFEGIDTGDEIEVTSSMVMLTYPSQTYIYSLKKLSDGSIDDIPQEVIDDLTELGWVKRENDRAGEKQEDAEAPVVISAGGKSVTPYCHTTSSGKWDGSSFLSMDGVRLWEVLPELEADGLIPKLYFADDLSVTLGEGVSFYRVLLFDQKFKQLETLWDISELSELEPGEYYVGIEVSQKGKYIEEIGRDEHTGMTCAFQLVFPVIPRDFTVSWANWSEDERVYFSALDREKFYISSMRYLPVYKVDTAEELVEFKESFGEILTMDGRYDEVPSFNDVTVNYDERFFEENALIITYVTSGSGSDRFGVNGVYCDGSALRVFVEQTNNPEVGTDDMAGWFLTVPVEDELIAGCTEFDAVFGKAGE